MPIDNSSSPSKPWIVNGLAVGAVIAVAVGAHIRRSTKFRNRVVGIIPARFASSRFQGKPLVQILGKPMIQRTWERAKLATTLDHVGLMAFEQNLQVQFESVGDASLEQKWKSVPASRTVSENLNGCFDCNICLDSAHDPIVTHCGHLYCWPCIYKWLHIHSSSPESEQQPNCPVCKASISKSSLVPLYGRGNSQSDSDAKRPQLNLAVPRRPPALGANTLPHQQLHPNLLQPQQQSFHHQQYFPDPLGIYASISPPNFVATAMTSPTVGTFGDMVYARMFGSSDSSLFSYPYTNYYPLASNVNSRVRRQELQADKSLNRVSMFLLCCLILCLLLF